MAKVLAPVVAEAIISSVLGTSGAGALGSEQKSGRVISGRRGGGEMGLPQGGGAEGKAMESVFASLLPAAGIPRGGGGGGEYKGGDGPYEGNADPRITEIHTPPTYTPGGPGQRWLPLPNPVGRIIPPPNIRHHPPQNWFDLRNPAEYPNLERQDPYSISESEYKRRENVEVAAIAHLTGLSRDRVRASEELMNLALPGITGVGHGISEEVPYEDWQSISDPQLPDVARNQRDIESTEEIIRSLPGDALLRDAMGDAGSAIDVVYTPDAFARILTRVGVDRRRIDEARARIFGQYTEQRARAIFRQWIVDKVIPKLAVAGGTYAIKEIMNVLNDPYRVKIQVEFKELNHLHGWRGLREY